MTRSERVPIAWSRYRHIVQVLVLALAVGTGLRYLLVAGAPSPEAYCPFGAVATAASLTAGRGFLRQISLTNGLVLGVVALSALGLGRLFCGWACPIGTLSDGLAGLSRRLFGRRGPYPWRVPRRLDRALRWLKLPVLGWILWASLTAVVPPLAPFCPYRTLFEFNLNTALSLSVVATFGFFSLMIERFWCRYLCPLGALLAPLNWISGLRPKVDAARCLACGRCERVCPAGIDPVTDGTDHPECVRCYACVQACGRTGAISFRSQTPDGERA
ncbi:MAG: 4Fe-4S binding protein [Anaerolineae bacterium]|nr:4Fe-4S binding protein [Anaerolineae bacterium]